MINVDSNNVYLSTNELDDFSSSESFCKALLEWLLLAPSNNLSVEKIQEGELIKNGISVNHSQYRLRIKTNILVELNPDDVV